ncbi:hypothetical protein RDI58_027664 [Solanum bulbocastanum]|uniref:Uncharacterized protein n=1 Tax=Solanum bulbocastanum TaxID=147425 RepID=A0AAN8T2T8_SOLBU
MRSLEILQCSNRDEEEGRRSYTLFCFSKYKKSSKVPIFHLHKIKKIKLNFYKIIDRLINLLFNTSNFSQELYNFEVLFGTPLIWD